MVYQNQLQSLLGKLLYVHRCVPPVRVFVNRLLNVLRSSGGCNRVCNEIKKDLNWFVNFLQQFNGVVMFDKSDPKLQVFVDASLSGMGAYWRGNAYAISRHVYATAGLSITQLEILNVLIALRTFAEVWKHRSVEFRVDNKAVVLSLQKGRI